MQFSQKYPGIFVVLLRTAVRFSQKSYFKKQPSGLTNNMPSGSFVKCTPDLHGMVDVEHRQVCNSLAPSLIGGSFTRQMRDADTVQGADILAIKHVSRIFGHCDN